MFNIYQHISANQSHIMSYLECIQSGILIWHNSYFKHPQYEKALKCITVEGEFKLNIADDYSITPRRIIDDPLSLRASHT